MLSLIVLLASLDWNCLKSQPAKEKSASCAELPLDVAWMFYRKGKGSGKCRRSEQELPYGHHFSKIR